MTDGLTQGKETTNATTDPTLAALQELIAVVAQLRNPEGGCPWDLEQTPQTLIPYVIEEAYEVADAIRRDEVDAIAEELGDLLLQVVLQAQIASEAGQFTLQDVAQGIARKLVRRHPHVFGEVEVQSIEEVRQNWDAIKATEKGQTTDSPHPLSDKLSRYARTLPPLVGGMKISRKAAAVGFEWDDVDGVWEKFQEELAEFQHAIEYESPARQQSELGDLLFTLINIARWHDLDPAEALHETNEKFIQRFSQVEAAAPGPLSDLSLEELDALWDAAKARLAQAKKDAATTR